MSAVAKRKQIQQKEKYENDEFKKLDGSLRGGFVGDGAPLAGRPAGNNCQTGKTLHGHGCFR